MARAYIGLGSNLGDGCANLWTAWHQLGTREGINLLALSSPYRTRPEAKPEWLAAGRQVGQQFFTNAVGMLATALLPLALLTELQAIELVLGRNRAQTVDRPVDLDLLYYDELVLREAALTLPHPEIANRRFVLAPLVELAPDLRHPILGFTSRQMLGHLPPAAPGEIEPLDWPAWGEPMTTGPVRGGR